ncbi:Oidioi.mRNA.OKI2018_I69.XSR.g14310.t1.cds [Oikopleura dioica]|nr:Oidioi.mRNA.OKI2018_I69.XSR.g14310.t1.cds [Oikopleura dioica]
MTVNIISDEQFGGHQGSGLIDPDCISFRTIKARKDLSWAKLKVKLADYLGCDEETFRIWFFKRKYIRSNNADHETWRPEFIDEDDMEKYVSQVSIDYKNNGQDASTTVWLELPNVATAQLQSFYTKRDLLIFLRLFDPDSGTIAYCGHLIVPISSKLKDLIPEMTRRAFWNEQPAEDEILMFEDRHLGYCIHLKDLNASMNEALLFQGDRSGFAEWKRCRYRRRRRFDISASGIRNVAEYFRDQANSHEVVFHNVEIPNDPGFVVRLNQRENYQHMASEVARVLNRDPKRIQFFKVPPYARDGIGQVVKSTEKRTIEDIIYLPNNKRFMMYMQGERESKKNRKKMFYQLISMDIAQFETKNQLPIKFLFADMREVDMILYANPKSTMKDLLDEVRTRIPDLASDSELRILEYINTRIITILAHSKEVEFASYAAHGASNQRHIRIDEVPEAHRSFAPGEILIQVGHFHSSVQNAFGTPFFVKICHGDTIRSVRDKIKSQLNVSEKEFAKWKIALIQSSRPRYYTEEEEDTVIDTKGLQVEECGGVPLVNNRIWIGLDHPLRQKPKPKQAPLPPITIRN